MFEDLNATCFYKSHFKLKAVNFHFIIKTTVVLEVVVNYLEVFLNATFKISFETSSIHRVLIDAMYYVDYDVFVT